MIQEEVIKTNEAVDLSWSVPTAGVLVVALVKFSAAPTTSENLQIIFKSKHGTDYDVQLYSVDPSTDSLTQIVWFPDLPVPINKKVTKSKFSMTIQTNVRSALRSRAWIHHGSN